ncbi:MAG: diphthine synthase [Candidatus Aenigmarchaeota archaeon]|nr:diphthine synthase [Candidatus Aenigmarchaeota archaeon]
MLTLIGLGLFDELDLTLRGLEAAKNADKIYIELYTGKWSGSLENLSEMVGKHLGELTRSDLEENSDKIVEEAKDKDIVIFVQGDPLVATTHASLLIEARKKDVEIQILHNASIFSSIAETGLHIYKFGQAVTIPFQDKTKGKSPQSIYNVIANNKERDLHTLCLLDIIGEKNKYLSVSDALEILLKLEEENGKGAITKDSKVVVFSSGKSSKIFYGVVKKLLKEAFELPAVIIIPAKLHFTEKEYLELYEI